MNHLIDAHCLIWAIDDPSKLGDASSTAIQATENKLFLSASTIWELSIKCGLSKLRLSLPFRDWMERAIADLDLTVLPINLEHADRQTLLPFHHRDPFDRLLASQALVEGIPFVSADSIFDRYGVVRIRK